MYKEPSAYTPDIARLLRRRPQAAAGVSGSASYPALRGLVRFWDAGGGTVVAAEFTGLPTMTVHCEKPVFAMHIHEGGSCTQNGADTADPFPLTGMHFNPQGCPHPYHAGDLPPLFGAGGYAFSLFYTDRFTVGDVLSRTVILHSAPDDFTSQPSGNAGTKIACGVIRPN